MDRDTVIALADKTGLFDYLDLEGDSVGQLILQNFAALVAEHEREECAKEADYEAARWPYAPEAREPCEEIAKAIRSKT